LVFWLPLAQILVWITSLILSFFKSEGWIISPSCLTKDIHFYQLDKMWEYVLIFYWYSSSIHHCTISSSEKHQASVHLVEVAITIASKRHRVFFTNWIGIVVHAIVRGIVWVR
jgi:hypothetical protein